MSDARERFLREIAERLPPDRVTEVHLFTPMRQGGMESGVAVVATEPDVVTERDVVTEPVVATEPDVVMEPSIVTVGEVVTEPEVAMEPDAAREPRSPVRPRRHTVYTACYRHTLKGPDRGKWEFEVVAEADAPLVTVDAVVRGVQRRTGELAEPERLGADDLRAILDDPAWRATTA